MKLGEDNMKLGETIDYMMENEIVSTIKTNDGNVIINGEMHGCHSDIPNSNTLYMLVIALNTGAITYKILELSKPDWERVNYSMDRQTKPEEYYRYLSYEYEDTFGNRKTSPREFNSVANIDRRCKYNGNTLIMINLH